MKEAEQCGGVAFLTDRGKEKHAHCLKSKTPFRPKLDIDYTITSGNPRAVLTAKGEVALEKAAREKQEFKPLPEIHFIVLEDGKRMTLPDRLEPGCSGVGTIGLNPFVFNRWSHAHVFLLRCADASVRKSN